MDRAYDRIKGLMPCHGIRDIVKFSILVALSAIFIDAVIAHGLFWENDPYWTYWITKTFLIGTVFSIGSAFLGIGIIPGIIITAIHTLILEVYYQWFSPVGLPQEPEWLDFNKLWTTGIPTHFLAVLAGYFIALWIWRRGHHKTICYPRRRVAGSTLTTDTKPPAEQYSNIPGRPAKIHPETVGHEHHHYETDTGVREYIVQEAIVKEHSVRESSHPEDTQPFVLYAIAAAFIAVVLDSLITHVLLRGNFPSVTYLIQHFLVGYAFILIWNAYVGLEDFWGWIIGAFMLSLTWVAYSMYLGALYLPIQLPYYLGYDELWFRAFPGGFIAALLGLWTTRRFIVRYPTHVHTSVIKHAVIIALISFSASLYCQETAKTSPELQDAQNEVQAPTISPEDSFKRAEKDKPVMKKTGLTAYASTEGNGVMVVGPNPTDLKSTVPLEGSISIKTIDRGDRWSHVQNTDDIDVTAEFTANSAHYKIEIHKPMPRHPLGAYTTWNGVVYRHNMHGDTNIGTNTLPKVKPDIALWGWATITKDGQIISKMAPAHVMVMKTDSTMPGIMLEVSTEEKDLLGAPDGYISIMWPTIKDFEFPEDAIRMRQLLGWIVLTALTLLFAWLAITTRQSIPRIRIERATKE